MSILQCHFHLANKLSELQLFIWDVPLLQVDAGLAGFTRDVALPTARCPTMTSGRRQLLKRILITLIRGKALFTAALLRCSLILRWVVGLLLLGYSAQ